MIKGYDGALSLFIGRRLGRDPLQPQARRGNERKERSAMLGGKRMISYETPAMTGKRTMRDAKRAQNVVYGTSM